MQNSYNTPFSATTTAGNTKFNDSPQQEAEDAIGSDEDAEKQLPRRPLVIAQYHRYRETGDTPTEALEKTLALWHELSHVGAYVPHRQPA